MGIPAADDSALDTGAFARAPAARVVAARRAPAGSHATVQLVDDHAGFMALARDWDALADRLGAQVFHRHAFIRIWLRHFGGGAQLRVLVLRDEGGTLRAVLPLLWRRTRLYGVPVRELAAAANLHSCRFDLLAEDAEAAARAFVAWLSARRDWDVLCLPDVPAGGRAEALLAEATRAGLAAGAWPSIASPFVPLAGGRDAISDGVRRHFLANLRRRRRRLGEKGTVTVERIDGGPQLRDRLADGLALERSGWKGRRGTAVAQDAATLGFYRELALDAAAHGTLALWLMRLNGRPVAFHFALEHDGHYQLLKPAYDEAIGACSPGQLLTETVLHDAVERGLHEFDFLGPSMPWKLEWTSHCRQHAWLFVFRGARGRMLHAIKFRLLPALRRLRTGAD